MSQNKSIIQSKIVVVGDEKVGKTALINRFLYNKFEEKYSETFGVDFFSKVVCTEKINHKINIFDTSCLEKFQDIVSSYYKGAELFIVVFDSTRKDSFSNAQKKIKELKEKLGAASNQCQS